MENPSTADVIVTLKQMIKLCNEVQELLLNDKNRFSQNKLEDMAESNLAKTKLLENLNLLTHELQSSTSRTNNNQLFEGLLKHKEFATHPEICTLSKELSHAVAKCYQELLINSKIIYTNLCQYKQLWNTLLGSKNTDLVYENKGNHAK
jgi:hypothetical protein